MPALETRIPPPALFLLIGAVMAVAAYAWPSEPMLPEIVRWTLVGALFALAGLFGPFAIARFIRAETTIDPVHVERATRLVTDGVYRFTRNPMYLSMTLLLLSLCAVLTNPWTFLGPPVFVALITRFQILPEERSLTARFGDEYLDYCARVRRWI